MYCTLLQYQRRQRCLFLSKVRGPPGDSIIVRSKRSKAVRRSTHPVYRSVHHDDTKSALRCTYRTHKIVLRGEKTSSSPTCTHASERARNTRAHRRRRNSRTRGKEIAKEMVPRVIIDDSTLGITGQS